MNYNSFKKVWPAISTILTGVGIAETLYQTAKLSPEAVDLMKYIEEHPELSTWGKLKMYAKLYSIPLGIAGLTFANVAGTNVVSVKQQASILALYELAKKDGAKYKRQVLEYLGPENVVKLEQKIEEARKQAEDPTLNDLGEESDAYYCFHDDIFGINMTRSLAEMHDAKYQIMKMLAIDEIVYLSDAYKIMGVPDEEIPRGAYDIFWDLETMVYQNHPWIDIDFIPAKTDDGLEFMEISYPYMPITKEDYLLNLEYERKIEEKEE